VPPTFIVSRAPRQSVRFLALAALLAVLPGCCSLARLFCGPDRSAWISESFLTADEAMRTVLEAIRRDDTRVLFTALGDDCKKRLGIADEMAMDVAWKLLQDKVTGIHLLGYGEIKRREPVAPDRVRFAVEAEGHQVQFVLRAVPCWAVYLADGDGRKEHSEYLTSLSEALSGPEGEQGTLTVRIAHRRFKAVLPEQIREVRVGYEWKVDEMVVPQG
jgi:hypothetical protein